MERRTLRVARATAKALSPLGGEGQMRGGLKSGSPANEHEERSSLMEKVVQQNWIGTESPPVAIRSAA